MQRYLKADMFLNFVKNIDFGFTLELSVLTSTRDICFRAKIRKNVYPVNTSSTIIIKVG